MRQVWLVDDDEEMSRAIALMLDVLGCEVMVFSTARSAVQTLISGKRPDVLVLDIHMPEISGLDLLEFLRRRPEWKKLPVLMLSVEDSDNVVDRAFQLGADFHLTKPVTLEELEKGMAIAIQKHVSVK